MSNSEILFGKEAREKLYAGLQTAAKAVTTTMGPKGKTVVIKTGDGNIPIVTKDGVTVSKSIKLKDPAQRIGADLLKEASSRTNDVAGDGTTTSSMLTWSLVEEGLKSLNNGDDAIELCKGIEAASGLVLLNLKAMAKPIDDKEWIVNVGTISANGDKAIGELIAEAMEKVGRDGIITVEDATGMSTTLEVVEGMQFDRGFVSPLFVTNPEKMNVTYQDCMILVTDRKITTIREMVPLLESIQRNSKPLLIIADDIEGEALHALAINKVQNVLKVVAIKAPGFGSLKDQLLEDIAVLTGANIISDKRGTSLEKVTLNDLGKAKKITVDGKSTVIVGNGSSADKISEHVSNLKTLCEDIKLPNDERTVIKNRIAKLSAGAAIIRVGGSTEVEMKERKYRIEDALNATMAAVDEGIFAGGGMALLKSRDCLSELRKSDHSHSFKNGVEIVWKSCAAPFRKIVENAGVIPEMILSELSKNENKDMGYNAATGDIVNMIEAGIIDPARVTRTALENAVSVANTFLTLDAVVVEWEEEIQKY
jgi:chaperonin GroEL